MIESNSVILIPLCEDHTKLILKWRNSKFVKDQLINQNVVTKKDHLNWLKNHIEKGYAEQFIIFSKEMNCEVGTIFIKKIDKINSKAELGIFIGDIQYSNRGIGRQALNLFLQFIFLKRGLNKIYLIVFSDNLIALELYKKIGFTVEGLLRQEYFISSTYRDIFQMSILRSEYLNQINNS